MAVVGEGEMEQTKMLEINKKCWDIVAPYFFQVDSLPKYGPYTASEDEIQLLPTTLLVKARK